MITQYIVTEHIIDPVTGLEIAYKGSILEPEDLERLCREHSVIYPQVQVRVSYLPADEGDIQFIMDHLVK